MTNLDAAQWVENQPGLKVTIGKDRQINLTDGATIDVTAIGWLAVVTKAQDVLRAMQANK